METFLYLKCGTKNIDGTAQALDTTIADKPNQVLEIFVMLPEATKASLSPSSLFTCLWHGISTLTLTLCVCLLAIEAHGKEAPAAPNIVLIMVDDKY